MKGDILYPLRLPEKQEKDWGLNSSTSEET